MELFIYNHQGTRTYRHLCHFQHVLVFQVISILGPDFVISFCFEGGDQDIDIWGTLIEYLNAIDNTHRLLINGGNLHWFFITHNTIINAFLVFVPRHAPSWPKMGLSPTPSSTS
jgi:hypothetical protein